MQIVGLPDTAVRESRERVRSAIRNCGFELAPRSVVIDLAPADVRKEGNHLDLAIALALLSAYEQIPPDCLDWRLFCGELGLDGGIRPIRGALAIAELGGTQGAEEVLLPAPNCPEAAALGAVPIIGVRNLAETVEHLLGVAPIQPTRSRGHPTRGPCPWTRYRRGAGPGSFAKRALEDRSGWGAQHAADWTSGAGKTMLARRLAPLLPRLNRTESIAVTKVQSLVAADAPEGLVTRRTVSQSPPQYQHSRNGGRRQLSASR